MLDREARERQAELERARSDDWKKIFDRHPPPPPSLEKRSRTFLPAEAAAILRISLSTLRRLLRRGALPGRKVGRHWRILRSDIERLTRSDRQKSRA